MVYHTMMGNGDNKKPRKTSFVRKIWEKIYPGQPTDPPDPGEDVDPAEAEAEEVEQSMLGAVSVLAAATLGAEPNQIHSKPKERRNRPTEQELAQELRTAFELYSKGSESIPCKEVGYILRLLGQNPTEDELITLVCEAGIEWDGTFTCEDFFKVAFSSVQKQWGGLDDVKAAFRAFDHNGDGNISKDELKDAMLRFGQNFSSEECDEMFEEADLNGDGTIDWEEFLEMMLPGHAHTHAAQEDPSKKKLSTVSNPELKN